MKTAHMTFKTKACAHMTVVSWKTPKKGSCEGYPSVRGFESRPRLSSLDPETRENLLTLLGLRASSRALCPTCWKRTITLYVL
jgi:hypothetical protein